MSREHSAYDRAEYIARSVASGGHRAIIGGLWEELGQLQQTFLTEQGLMPHHRFIDIGCGSLRAGVPLTRYLDPDRYYGIDLSEDLLEAGYKCEIVPEKLDGKLPRNHLVASDDFDLSSFGARFDYGIAQSVFSHTPVEVLSRCLDRIAPHFVTGGRFYATYFERPEDAPVNDALLHTPGGVVTYPDRDPYDVTPQNLRAATTEDWDLTIIGNWDHPKDQRMALFTRGG